MNRFPAFLALLAVASASWGQTFSSSITPINQANVASQTFTVTFSDSNGNGLNGTSGISAAAVLFNYGLDGTYGCYLIFVPAALAVGLQNDSGDGSQGTMFFGADGNPTNGDIPANSQCGISASGAHMTAVNGASVSFTLPITFLSTFVGTQTAYALIKDFNNNDSAWQPLGTWSAFPSAGPPTAVSVSPQSGQGAVPGFAYTVSSPNGYRNLQWEMLGLNGVDPGTCAVLHFPGSRTGYLQNDNGDDWQWNSPILFGSAASVSNRWCTLSGGASSASGSGNQLVVLPGFTMLSSFAGDKTVSAVVQGRDGLNTGSTPVALGTWTVFPPPLIGLSSTSLSFNAVVESTPPTDQTVTVSNTGGGTLSWSAAATTSSGGSWLSVAPGSGADTGTLTVSVSASGLTVGTYNGTITMSASGAANTPQTIAVTLAVVGSSAGGGEPPPPADPIYAPRATVLWSAWQLDGNRHLIPYAYMYLETGPGYGNAHFHSDPTQPYSTFRFLSDPIGTTRTGAYGQAGSDGYLKFYVTGTLVGQPEYVANTASGGTAYANFTVGYADLYYNDHPEIWIKIGGSETGGDSGHGSTAYNRYMRSYAAYGLYNATQDYFLSHPDVTQICTNDMALPFGGKFDICNQAYPGCKYIAKWQSPHAAHDRGTAVDVAGPTSGQCPVANRVNIGEFLASCRLKGADTNASISEGNHAHCNWASPATYPH